MDRDHLGSLLFLSSLAASAAACAGGTGNPGPRPNPFGSVGDNDDAASGETWTDPLQTSGSPDSDGSKGGGSTGDWPNEGETGSPANGETGGPDIPPDDDTGQTGMGSTSGASGGSTGSYDDEGSSGYYDPPVGGDPCPTLAQLYSYCNSDYLYSSEIDFCQESRAAAQAISVGCGVAHTEFLACLSTLDCATLLQPGVPFPCLIQGAATDIACSL